MSDNVQAPERRVETTDAERAVERRVEALERAAEQVRRDSRRAPQQYLDETVAEYGGE